MLSLLALLTVASALSDGAGAAGTAVRMAASEAEPAASLVVETTKAERSIPGINQLILAHIILESIAFCFFLPLGVFFAVFRFHPNIWFPIHVACNVAGAGCAIAGFVVIVIEVSSREVSHFAALRDSPTRGTHPMLGLILIAMLLVQALLGVAANYAWRRQMLRDPASLRTPLVARVHQAWGRLIFVTSIADVFLGVREALLDDWVFGVYGALYGFVALAVIAMHFFKSRHEWRTFFYAEKPAMVAMASPVPVSVPVSVVSSYPAHYGQPTESMFHEGQVHL